MIKKKPYSISLPEDVIEILEKLAKEEMRNNSQMAQVLILEALKARGVR